MTARFRTVHFVPDPFREATFPIAALVKDDRGHVFRERAAHLPGPACLGGRREATLVQVGLNLLGAATFDELPGAMGPYFRLGREREVPASVSNPAAWVRECILLRKPFDSDDLSERRPAGPQRATYGTQFFKTWKVDRYVQRKYDGDGLGVAGHAVQSITHWVPGKDQLLLMEPIVTTRADPIEDLRQISQTFLAWQRIFSNRKLERAPAFIAYVLGGHSETVWSQARAVLAESKAELIDVDIPSLRTEFLDRIRHVGASVPQQSDLGLQS